MVTLVTGGSGSGKSAYAESLVTELGMENRYYLATMMVYDDDGRRKVDRHRQMRAGKGFATIEKPLDIATAVEECQPDSVALLECMSNLVANEMFRDGGMVDEDTVVDKVVKEMEALYKHYENLIIVTNNIFEDGIDYDEGSKAYMRALGRINAGLAQMADAVYEVVVGIPVRLR